MKTNILTETPRSEYAASTQIVADVFQFEVLRKNSVWVFDDAAKGVQNEPFVCGMNEIIDAIVERFGIPAVDGQRISATFCDARVLDHTDVDRLVKDCAVARLVFDQPAMNSCPPEYTPYKDSTSGLHGAFCPVFKAYFPDSKATPKELLLLPEVVEKT